MAGYTFPSVAFGTPPTYGFATGPANIPDQVDATQAIFLSNLTNITGAITAVPAGPTGSTTAIIGSSAGTTGQGTTASIVGNDLAGTVTVTGITGTNTGPYATVAFAGRGVTGSAVLSGPNGVIVSGPGSPYATGISSTGFTVNVTTNVVSSAKLSYLVLG